MRTDELAPVIPVVLSHRSGPDQGSTAPERGPEHFLPLLSGLSRFQETVCRGQVATGEQPVVVCDLEDRDLVEHQLGRLGVTPAAIVWEHPVRSTASAVAVAALAIGGDRSDALLLVLRCDVPESSSFLVPRRVVLAELSMPVAAPTEAVVGSAVRRPWGTYRSLDVGPQHQVKRLVVEPGHRLSLQRHRRRSEHWVVVQGTAAIVCGEEARVLHENESVFIPVGCAHRLENPGSGPLHLVEVQVGDYLGEDDIERLADDYGRT
jgi:mannose-6-phosphate isomerase-like protein (cupin superfamily)